MTKRAAVGLVLVVVGGAGRAWAADLTLTSGGKIEIELVGAEAAESLQLRPAVPSRHRHRAVLSPWALQTSSGACGA
jgi:hypothetical protein